MPNRREFLKATPTAAGVLLLGGALSNEAAAADIFRLPRDSKGQFTLPPLPHAYDALEPHIDEQTMRLHHDVHHAGYVKGLNAALRTLRAARESGDRATVAEATRKLAFHGSDHALHSIFWQNMCPKGGGEPRGELAQRIRKDFGTFRAFKAQFIQAAATVEGSGWGILGYHPGLRQLVVLQVEKQQNLAVWSVIPLLVVDV